MKTIRRRVGVAALGALAAIGIAAGPASASPIAYNTRTQYLTDVPTNSTPTSCVSRSIYLASGTYSWQQSHDGYPDNGRSINLAAGTYFWEDCLDPTNGYYLHTSRLVPLIGTTAELDFGWLSYAGTHTWGSYLNPSF